MATLYFYHDPMCSWCWGYRSVSDQIFAALPENVELVKIVGGLAPDSNEPMPESLRQKLPMVWQEIHDLLGTEFNFDFWAQCEPRRSTYPACRAVLAAGEQNRYDDMSDAIQRAYYLRAMNPSDVDTLVQLATEMNLDVDRFTDDLASEKTEGSLRQQVEFSRQSPIDGFPSLTMDVGGTLVSVQRDYQDPKPTLSHISVLLQ
ncbi:MAG: DsbA family protein [Woeseia sp.]|jgi:putative protein-disulfide isomerase|nr:DsbA family protein [Woeseia sp.]MBT6210957.1 DsbA family protein [Woeseia sp.]